MAISIFNIGEEKVRQILAMDEGHFVDLKSQDITPAKLSKTISAFANADGGELYIGIDETIAGPTKKRRWRGFVDPEAANAHLQVFESLFPLGTHFSYNLLQADGYVGLILQVEVHKTPDIKFASDRIAYLRRGAQNLPQTDASQLERLRLNKGLSSFETHTVAAAKRTITNSEAIIDFMLEVIPSAEPDAWLRKQQLILDDKPTVCGVLLFADEPQAIIPKRCAIKIYRYKTDETGTRDTLAFNPITTEGNTYAQIHAAVEKTVEVVESISALEKGGLQNISYPHETLHEIITNAVLHRDYSIADDVHVRVFDNRIEVESPGTLPAHITPANILDERYARNGNLVRLINKFPDPPNKDVGEGLNTAFEAMRKVRLKPPEIKQRGNSVLVVIRHEPLASHEEIVMQYLEDNPSINNSKAREICFIGSESIAKRLFKRLIASGLIEQVPGTRGSSTAYRKVRTANA